MYRESHLGGFKQKKAYERGVRRGGSERGIRERGWAKEICEGSTRGRAFLESFGKGYRRRRTQRKKAGWKSEFKKLAPGRFTRGGHFEGETMESIKAIEW